MTKIKYKDKFITIVSTPPANNKHWEFNEHIKPFIKSLYSSLLKTSTDIKKEINKLLINTPTNIEKIFERVFDKFIKKYELKFFINNYFIDLFMKELKKIFIKEISSNIQEQFPNFLDKAEQLGRYEQLLENYTKDTSNINIGITPKGLKSLTTTREATETLINGIFNIIENSKSGRLLIFVCKIEKLKQDCQGLSSLTMSRDNFLGILNLYIKQIPNVIKNFGKQHVYGTTKIDFTEAQNYALLHYSLLQDELAVFNQNNPNGKKDFSLILQHANKEALSALLNNSICDNAKNTKAENNIIAENVSSWLDRVSLSRIRRTCREAAGYSVSR